MAVNSCSQGFPLSICLWTPIRQAPMCPNHNNKFYVIVICPTNQSLFYKLVHPKDLIKQSDLSTAERMKLKELTQVVPSSPGRGATLQVGSRPRSARHRLAAEAACRWGRPPRPRSRPPLEPLDAGTRAPRPRTRWGRPDMRPATRVPAPGRPDLRTAPNPTSARRSRETEEHLRLWEGRSLSFG